MQLPIFFAIATLFVAASAAPMANEKRQGLPVVGGLLGGGIPIVGGLLGGATGGAGGLPVVGGLAGGGGGGLPGVGGLTGGRGGNSEGAQQESPAEEELVKRIGVPDLNTGTGGLALPVDSLAGLIGSLTGGAAGIAARAPNAA